MGIIISNKRILEFTKWSLWGWKFLLNRVKSCCLIQFSTARFHTNVPRIFVGIGRVMWVAQRWSSWSIGGWLVTVELDWLSRTRVGPECNWVFSTEQWQGRSLRIIGFSENINSHGNIYSNGAWYIILQSQSFAQFCKSAEQCRIAEPGPEIHKSSERGLDAEKAVSQWRASEVCFRKKKKNFFKLHRCVYFKITLKIFINFQSFGSYFTRSIVYKVAES